MTERDAKALIEMYNAGGPAQYIALVSFLASVGLAFVLEDQSVSGMDRDAIFARAEELYTKNDTTLAAHLDEYRAAQQTQE